MRHLTAVLSIALSAFLSSCTTARNLVALDHPAPKHISNPKPLENIVVGSGKSEKPHSSILIGAWIVMRHHPVMMFDLVIKNSDAELITAPDLIYAEDANGVRLPVLPPSAAVAILYGKTQPGAYAASAATLGAAGVYALANPTPSTSYTYGTAQPNMFGGYNYSGQTQSYSEPNYGATMLAAGGLAMAAEAGEMGKLSMMLEILSIKPQPVQSGGTVAGKVLFVDGDLPVTVHVMAGGDQHDFTFDSISAVKNGARKPTRLAEQAKQRQQGASSLRVVDPYNGQWPPAVTDK